MKKIIKIIPFFIFLSAVIGCGSGDSTTTSKEVSIAVSVTQYTLNLTTTGSGTVSLNPPGGVYDPGTPVELTAHPASGWEFSGWSADLSGTANPATITMNADKNLTATFTAVSVTQYTLNATISGSGTVSLNPPGGVYDPGTPLELTAQPASGWEFSGWSVDLSGTANPATITMNADKNVTATFTAVSVTQYTLNATISGSGTVSLNPAGGVYDADTPVELTAEPSAGWEFRGWSGDLSGTANPATIIMSADNNVTATFTENTAVHLFAGGSPKPGDVYKEFAFNNNTTNWRVTDPNTANSGAIPYLPNPVLPLANLSTDDLQGAIKAELIVDLWGGHYGTNPKMYRINGNDWVTIPELDDLPTAPPPANSGENYMQQINHLIEVPVGQLLEGQNTLEGTSGPNPWDWGQWGWFGVILRIYYDTSKPHATGQITSPVSGSSFGDNPAITASVSGNVNRVDFLAYYEGYDSDGDGVFKDWHRNYHRKSWTSPISIKNHVGTVTSAPFQLTWNTQWIPDQPSGQVKFIARIRDNNNIWFVTDEVSNLTLQRTDFSVLLFKPQDVPQVFWVRDGQIKSSKVNISTLTDATAAMMNITTWNGNDGTDDFYSKVNNWTAPKYGSNSFHSYDQVPVPLSALISGENLITFSSSTIHHGIEVMWPGPAIMVKYDLASGTQYTLNVTTTGSGTVTLNPAGGVYDPDTPVELTAVPASGWEFSGWSGGLSGTANPATITMDADKNVTATFTDLSGTQYTLNTTTSGSGTVSLNPPGGVYDPDTPVELTAQPASGWEFSGWSGDLSGTANPATFTMDADKNVTANFTASSSDIVSDDFNQNNLDIGLWYVVDPLADATVVMSGAGTGNAHLLFSVPAGPSHNPWIVNTAPRLLQLANDTDFAIEVKFDSILDEKIQVQGIIVEEGSDHFLRFDLLGVDGSSIRIFSASLVNGSPSVKVDQLIAQGSPMYLRVVRIGNNWTISYSYDGAVWTEAVVFSHPMVVTAVGPYVGNYDSGGNAPAHTAVIDYFFNQADPIVPEDGGVVEDILPPLIQRVESSAGPTTVQVTWVTDEPSSGILNYGETLALGFSEGHADLRTSHTIIITDLHPETLYYFQVVSEDRLTHQSISETFSVTTLAMEGLGPTIIDAWYGAEQTFGARGRPQRWLNVLGNTSDPDGVKSLTYSLNAGPQVPLNLGPDDFRLEEDGDYNIEIDVNDPNLNVFPLQNSVLIRALDIYDNETTLEVTVNYHDGNVWPESDTIDWSSFSSINDVAGVVQIVDGLWTLEADKIRSIQSGYDRLVSIGDIDPTWDNYEVTVPITVHSIEEIYGPPGGGPTLGVIVRWQGHTADGNQPSIQWWPLGAFGAYKWRSTYQRLEILDHDYTVVDNSGFELQLGVEYMFKLRVESDVSNSIYSLKVWPVDTPEPADWALIAAEALSSDKTAGSVLLVAQFVDASFGKVTITPLP